MKFTHLIFDSNNLFYKSYSISNKDLKKTMIKFIELSDYYKNKYLSEFGKIIYCFDNPTSRLEVRNEIDPNYKKNRKIESSDFYKTLDYLKLLLLSRSNNSQVISVSFCEADDIVKPLLEKLDLKYSRILLMSEDLDWARGLQDNVFWYSKKTVYDKKLFQEKYGFLPTSEKIILYKTIRGDHSDFIKPGIPGIRTDDVLKIIEQYNSLGMFISEYKKLDYLSETIKKIIKDNEALLKRNFQLIRFLELKKDDVDDNTLDSEVNYSELKNLYEMIGYDIKDVEKNLVNNSYIKSDKSKEGFFQVNEYPVV
jgi:hypothetical protein